MNRRKATLLVIDDAEIVVGTDAQGWGQVEAAIEAMDASERSFVAFGEERGVREMLIGGGEGQYVVSIQEPDSGDGLNIATLTVAMSWDGRFHDLVAGGVLGNFPSDIVVDLDTTLQAARAYFETGGADGRLPWRWQMGA